MKPAVRLTFTDFPGPTNIDLITDILKERYEIILDERDPDFVVYSVFGNRFLNYPDAIRICFIAENVRPDFNLCDYAFSFDYLDFGDRHFRAPNFVIYPQWQSLFDLRRSNITDLISKPGFCNFIYSNGNGDPTRDEFFRALNSVKMVESFGSHLRNTKKAISDAYGGNWIDSKVSLQKSFRFTIAFENCSAPGYTTEKIVHALAADTVPIYWGDPSVSNVFNPERFIDVRKIGFDASIDRVMDLENNPSRLLDMLNQPFFSENAPLESLSRSALLDHFGRILSQPISLASRRDKSLWGPKYENQRRKEVKSAEFLDRLMTLLPKRLRI